MGSGLADAEPSTKLQRVQAFEAMVAPAVGLCVGNRFVSDLPGRLAVGLEDRFLVHAGVGLGPFRHRKRVQERAFATVVVAVGGRGRGRGLGPDVDALAVGVRLLRGTCEGQSVSNLSGPRPR